MWKVDFAKSQVAWPLLVIGVAAVIFAAASRCGLTGPVDAVPRKPEGPLSVSGVALGQSVASLRRARPGLFLPSEWRFAAESAKVTLTARGRQDDMAVVGIGFRHGKVSRVYGLSLDVDGELFKDGDPVSKLRSRLGKPWGSWLSPYRQEPGAGPLLIYKRLGLLVGVTPNGSRINGGFILCDLGGRRGAARGPTRRPRHSPAVGHHAE